MHRTYAGLVLKVRKMDVLRMVWRFVQWFIAFILGGCIFASIWTLAFIAFLGNEYWWCNVPFAMAMLVVPYVFIGITREYQMSNSGPVSVFFQVP